MQTKKCFVEKSKWPYVPRNGFSFETTCYHYFRDLKGGHYIREKISSKSAKEVYDHYNKFEKEHKHIFSGLLLDLLLFIVKSQKEIALIIWKLKVWFNFIKKYK